MAASTPSFFEMALAGNEQTTFNMWEPFDIPPRPAWLLEKAKQAEIEIEANGNEFQIGMMLDVQETPGSAMAAAATQTGKSELGRMEAIIMASGQIPISLRYPAGVDTGIQRLITKPNIARFGRIDIKTGEVIDNDVKVKLPYDGGDWNCGNIIGVGIYPPEKIPQEINSQIWVCTWKEAKDRMWIPRLRELIPPYFLNQKRGVNGWLESKQAYFFDNGNIITFITYEQDYRRVEAEKAKVAMIILDEEPPIRKFWTSAMEHCKYLRTYFTPINGLNWMYHDVYLPVLSGANKFCKIYRCSQYDSPYQDGRTKIDQKIKTYKPYELKARVWGQFSDMQGKPYYTFDITQKNLRTYVPRHSYAKIWPTQKPETVREALKLKMLFENMDEPGEDVWEIYEEYRETDTYWLAADIAEGNENPEAAADASVAYIRRLPREGEVDPVLVAALYSRMRNVEFAWMCLYGAIFYNLCLMAPEARGEDAAVFLTTIINYPFIYQHVVTSDKTRRLKEVNGFDTTVGNRKVIFDLAGTWIYDRPDNPRIFHYELLKEYAECIVGKNGRPDHGENGHTDCLVPWGISQFVYTFAKNQIRNNRSRKYSLTSDPEPMTFPNIFGNRYIKETRKILGSSQGLDNRARFDKKYATQTM